MKLTKEQILTELQKSNPNQTAFRRQEIIDVATAMNPDKTYNGGVYRNHDVYKNKVGRGLYELVGDAPITKQEPVIPVKPKTVSPVPTFKNYVPEIDKLYVPWGNSNKVRAVLKSKTFLPMYITGETGGGKTYSVIQECAKLKREVIRVNITSETDESDLIGSWALIDGNTVWNDGPVVQAMKKGSLLLLDECLEENEEVRIGTVDDWKPIKLKDLEYNHDYPVVSYNMKTSEYENDTGSIISDREDELYVVELEDGRTITLNADHPFILNGNIEKSINDGLKIGDDIIAC